jgi:hypothetical protein
MRLIFCLSSHCSKALPSCTAQHNVFPVEDVHYFVFLHDLSLVRGVKLEQVAFVLTHCCLSIQEDRRTDEIDVTHVSQVKRPIEEHASTCKVDSLQLLEFIGSIVNVQWAVTLRITLHPAHSINQQQKISQWQKGDLVNVGSGGFETAAISVSGGRHASINTFLHEFEYLPRTKTLNARQ